MIIMFDHHDLDNIKLLRITMIMFQVISHQGGKEGMMETDKNPEELYTEAKELLSLVSKLKSP